MRSEGGRRIKVIKFMGHQSSSESSRRVGENGGRGSEGHSVDFGGGGVGGGDEMGSLAKSLTMNRAERIKRKKVPGCKGSSKKEGEDGQKESHYCPHLRHGAHGSRGFS